MTPFNLTALPPILLKKITTKLEWKSSFRLQQTSKKMEEFVRIHRNFQEIYMVTCGNPMVEINDHGIANFRRYYDFIKGIIEKSAPNLWEAIQPNEKEKYNSIIQRIAMVRSKELKKPFRRLAALHARKMHKTLEVTTTKRQNDQLDKIVIKVYNSKDKGRKGKKAKEIVVENEKKKDEKKTETNEDKKTAPDDEPKNVMEDDEENGTEDEERPDITVVTEDLGELEEEQGAGAIFI